MTRLEPYAFVDDAGKWNDQDAICLCGYLATGKQWEDFVPLWQSRLQKHGLTRLHMAKFYGEAAARGWDDAKANAVLIDIAGVMRDLKLIGIQVGLDAKHYKSLTQARKSAMPKPHIACFQMVLRLISDRLHQDNVTARITLVIDEEEGSVVSLYKDILTLRQTRQELGKYIGSICFADDEFYTPLQAADMLANHTFKYFRDIISGVGSVDVVPEVLHNIITDASKERLLDIHYEYWTAKALDDGIDEIVAANTTQPNMPSNPAPVSRP
jgi:uncharacterized protein DUF3800